MQVIERYIAEWHIGPTVAARLRRLNPNLQEGEIVRGTFHKSLSWRRAKIRMRRDGFCNAPFRAPWGKTVSPFLEGPASLAQIERRRCVGCHRFIKPSQPGWVMAAKDGHECLLHSECTPFLPKLNTLAPIGRIGT
jgi:hypothetical protein